jgi:hypothetical protein
MPTDITAGQVSPTADYGKAWRAYRLRRGAALALLFGWLPFCAGIFLVSRFWIDEPEWSIVAMGVWLAAALAAVWWAGEFRCPRCRRRYGALGMGQHVDLTRGLFTRICYNCKLAKFERRA